MPTIINIDTTTNCCSVALSQDTSILVHYENHEGQNHAALLSTYIQRLTDYCKLREIKIDAVAVSIGPGSYTGLRIGLSEAKGLCFGLDIPLIAVNTLKLLTCAVMFHRWNDEGNVLYCPMIDARRMEVYSAVYNNALTEVSPMAPVIVDENTYSDLLKDNKILFFGNGANKCKDVIKSENAEFIDDIDPLAIEMVALSEKAFRENDFQNIAYCTPTYLKDFVATTPKNKAL